MAGRACSFENSRTKAYSTDMRWRMIYQNKFIGRNYRQIAECLNVDASTVCRTVHLFDETGSVAKRDYPENQGTKKLTDIDKLIILEMMIENPGIYLHEVTENIKNETGTEVSKTTVCRFLHKSGFTRQKMVIAAKQRCDYLRAQYLIDVSIYNGHSEFLSLLMKQVRTGEILYESLLTV